MGFFGFPNLPGAEFPAASSDARIYACLGISTLTNQVATQNTMSIYPYYVKKETTNPKLVIEQTNSGSATVLVGIYDGALGLPSAKLLYSGSISTTGNGLYKDTSNIFLQKGYYILCGICTTATPPAYRSMTLTGPAIEIFGRASSDESIDTGYYLTQTGQTSLPSSIGTITRAATPASSGPSVFIEY